MKKKGQKILSLLLSLTMLIGMAVPLTVMTTARSPIDKTDSEDIVTGDADGDGKVTASDAREMIKASIGTVEFDETQMSACDFDSDGKISLIEARCVLRFAAKLSARLEDSYDDKAKTEDFTGTPQLIIEGKYDNNESVLTVSVAVDNASGHLAFGGYLEYSDELEYISSENGEGSFVSESGTADGKAVFGAITATSFKDTCINLAQFKFKVDREKAGGSVRLTCALSVDGEAMGSENTFIFDISICSLPPVEDITGSEDVTGADEETTAPAEDMTNSDEETTAPDDTYEPAQDIMLGDTDGNGKITAQDAREMIRFSLNLENPTKYQMKVCDLDADGKISLMEARSVMRFAAKLTKFVVDSLDDKPEGNADTPDFTIITSYDENEDVIFMKVVAENLENHLTVKGYLDIPDGLTYISSENLASSAAMQTGITTDGVSAAFGGLATIQFSEDIYELAEFKFKVNHDMVSEPIPIGGAFIVDEDNAPLHYVDEFYMDGDNSEDPDPDDNIRDNFLYPWFLYDEDQECAVFNIQLCNFQHVSDFPSGKITLNYPTDMFKYIGFDPGETDGVNVQVTETSDGVLVVDYTAEEDVPAVDNMLVDLKFDVISSSGFAYAEIKSVSPTYMTDADGNQIDFSIGKTEAICAHKHMEKLGDIAPTCAMHGTRGGSKCKTCGYTTGTEYIAPLGHTRAEGGKCTVCGKYNEIAAIFDGEYFPESGMVNVNVKLDNAEDACAYDVYIEYPSDKLIFADSSDYLDGKNRFLENGSVSAYEDEINGKSYIIISASTFDYSSLSEQVNDIYCNFKFYCTDKNADSLTFTIDSSEHETQSRVFLARDMINYVPDCTFTLETSGSSQEEKELGLTSGIGISLDNENKTVELIPYSVNVMTGSEFRTQFTDEIESDIGDTALVYNGMKFKYNGTEYTVIIKGDTKADGKITAADARTILRISAKLDTPDEITSAAADINSDGKISSSEARDALRFSAKLTSVLYTEGKILNDKIKKTG